MMSSRLLTHALARRAAVLVLVGAGCPSDDTGNPSAGTGGSDSGDSTMSQTTTALTTMLPTTDPDTGSSSTAATDSDASGTDSGSTAGGASSGGSGSSGTESGSSGTESGSSGTESGPSGTESGSGSGTAGGVPDGWTCDPSTYGSGTCGCGCGVPDSDCFTGTPEECEVCNYCDSNMDIGWSCGPSLNPDDLTACVSSTCGDGILEGDEQCDGDHLFVALGYETCADLGFAGGELACQSDCTDLDLSGCTGNEIEGWTCAPAFYDAGDGCDCGCGVIDPDCAGSTADSCDYCAGPGSCTGFLHLFFGCPDIILPEDNTQCR